MNAQASTLHATALAEAPRPQDSSRSGMTALALRVRGEFVEMPGLRLTTLQAARLFGVAADVARDVLDQLRDASVLTYSNRGTYSLVVDSGKVRTQPNGDVAMASALETSAIDGSLSGASVDRLTSLQRHWAWANEAMERFDRELAGWEYDEDPAA